MNYGFSVKSSGKAVQDLTEREEMLNNHPLERGEICLSAV